MTKIPFENRKPKLLIIGHARHGKDTFADKIVKAMDLSFVSSSEFVGRRAVWPGWGNERYLSYDEMYEDRINFRSTWANLILAYNTPDLSRTGTEMMQDHDVYVGMRNPSEFKACIDKDLFDYVIWVDGSSRHPPEGKDSMGLTADMADMLIDNNGPESNMDLAVTNLQKRLYNEGYQVNYIPGPNEATEGEAFIAAVKEDVETADPMHMSEEDYNAMLKTKCMAGDLEELDLKYKEVEDDSLNVGGEPMTDEEEDLLLKQLSIGWSKKPRTWTDMPENAHQVLDHGFFKVLSVMGTDQAIVDAARMSYGRGTKPTNSSAGLINYLVRNYHTSPLEMCEIKFHIRMPIFVMRQWVRHRTANLNEYSGRYSEMVRLFYVPENGQICLQDKVNKQGSAEPMSPKNAQKVRDNINQICSLSFDEYENLLKWGVSRETARMVLPLNTYTEVVWKLDVSNLLKFLRLRDDDHAQWEIRQYAIWVSKAVEEYFPLVFAAYQEARQSQTLTMDEVRTLVTGDLSFCSISQAKRISLLRNDILA